MAQRSDPLRHLSAWSKGLPQGLDLSTVCSIVLIQRIYAALHTAKGSIDLIDPMPTESPVVARTCEVFRELSLGLCELPCTAMTELVAALTQVSAPSVLLKALDNIIQKITKTTHETKKKSIHPDFLTWFGPQRPDGFTQARMYVADSSQLTAWATSKVVPLAAIEELQTSIENLVLPRGGFIVAKTIRAQQMKEGVQTLTALAVEVRALIAVPLAIDLTCHREHTFTLLKS